jgi:cleavage stimulation factor subunit 3
VTRPLERHLPAIPLEYMKNDEEQIRQVQGWKRYILWEKQNPLKLDNQQSLMRRVLFAYEQSFLCLAYHCDIWHEAACYLHKQCNKQFEDRTNLSQKELYLKQMNDEAASCLYERSINTFMRNNILINLAYADFEESRKNYGKCHEIYEKCLKNQQMEPTLIWIHYIKFVKRTEDLNSARKFFKRAREDQRTLFHLFISNANLEYFCTKDKTIGFKILHLGAKKFGNEEDFMLAYLKYMSHLNGCYLFFV